MYVVLRTTFVLSPLHFIFVRPYILHKTSRQCQAPASRRREPLTFHGRRPPLLAARLRRRGRRGGELALVERLRRRIRKAEQLRRRAAQHRMQHALRRRLRHLRRAGCLSFGGDSMPKIRDSGRAGSPPPG